jgi:dihydroxyacetone kinase-like protein
MAPAPVQLVRALTAAAAALENSADELNRLDGYAGDGDLGITMSEAGRALRDVVAANPDMEAAPLLSACGAAIARKAPSTSGTLLATGFLRAAKAVAEETGHADVGSGDAGSGVAGSGVAGSGVAGSGVAALEHAFAAGTAGIQARGKAAVGDRTLVDGLDAVCANLRESLAAGRGLEDTLDRAAQAASVAAEKTVGMEPKVGRASWVPQRALGHPDAGCAMLAIVLRAAATGIAVPGPGPTVS